MNTSEIGQNSIDNSSTIGHLISDIDGNLTATLDGAVADIARRIGVHDFYTANIMSYCEGYFTPTAVPNTTVTSKDIHKNFTSCSNMTAAYNFDPREIIQAELNKTGLSEINISDLDWPSDIDTGLRALHVAQKATFVLYCIGIGLIGVATIFAILSVFLSGRLSAFVNVLLAGLAFLAIGLASAIVTAVVVHGTHLINKYGKVVTISANVGGKFLALTWAATAAMVICSLWWCLDCLVGRRRSRGTYTEKSAQ